MIRPLIPADCAAAAAVSATASEAWSETALTETIASQAGRLYGLWVEEQLAGAAIFQLVLDEASLEGITLLPQFRGKGLSRNFLSGCLTLLEDEGAAFCFLEVRASNHPAIALYEGLGFEKLGLRKGFYRNPTEDAVTYKLEMSK